VRLEFDWSQGRVDRYGRTLAYLWTGRPGRLVMFNRRAVRAGFAQEYTYDSAYAWQRVMRHAEGVARTAGRGLWATSTCNGDIEQPDDRRQ
jgi:micrococcal nuclease